MELKYEPLQNFDSNSNSFYIERKKDPYFVPNWHYHDEYELFLSIKGNGLRIIGDSIDDFNPNELVFMGDKIPHLFKNDDGNTEVDFIVLKFKDDINLLNLPELNKIKNFLKDSKRGILFKQETVSKVKPLLIKLVNKRESARIIIFLKILRILSNDEEVEYLASENFSNDTLNIDGNRIQKVLDYLQEEYTRDICLEELAEIANMTKNAFCRYFKSRTGRTPFQVVREYRINKACQMLINGEKSISEICYDTGFNSSSTFNRNFKSLKNISASEYKSYYLKERS
jgi:AraC-like DNA-binding protein